jgi:formate hydrogenlyase subunit 5
VNERHRPITLTEPRDLLPARTRGALEPGPEHEVRVRVPLNALDRAGDLLAEHAARFITLFQTSDPEDSLIAAFALRGELVALRAQLDVVEPKFPTLARAVPAAAWAERELHDRTGILPLAHPDLRPITYPDASELQRTVAGDDVFTIPYGPVRSGVFEAIQFQIDTGGEDVDHVETRTGFKHRALEQRVAGTTLDHGAYYAERIAGIASVAHVSAYCHAVERALGIEAPARAGLWRAVFAELERIANHLDVAAKEAETAALAVGQARMLILKENVLRLQAALTGSRFARGVVTPGGVRYEGRLPADRTKAALEAFERELIRDRELLLGTTSFTDRLIGSGPLPRATIERLAAVGPLARGSGISTDARFERPYGAYRRSGFEVVTRDDGDAMARVEVRFAEIEQSLHLLRQLIDRLIRRDGPIRADLPSAAGSAFGWAEAPQGEVVYWVRVTDGRVAEAHIASPSLRNWRLFAESFRGDVLTDFAFIEHSFGLTMAGADR